MKTQICMITGQPLANLIAILHFKPEQIFLVASESMKVKAKEFEKILADLGIAEKVFTLDGCPDTNLQAINQFLTEKLAEKLPQEPCIFNLTGGKKLHSFSMYDVFKNRAYQDQFIYVDTDNHLLEYYPNKQIPSFNEPLPVVLDANMTLKGMGKQKLKASSDQSNWREKVLDRQELTFWIAENIQRVSVLLGRLNGIVATIYPKQKETIPQNQVGYLKYMPRDEGWELLDKAANEGVIIWDEEKEISFNSYEQARYLTGDWIEEYVWLIAKDMGFEEVYCGLKFGNEVNNEIDLFIQHRNLSLAIECKSASRVEQNMCHKLNSIAHRAGGLMCSKLFVSAFPLDKNQKSDMNLILHAKEQHIKILQSDEIFKNLSKILEKWKNEGRL